MFFAFRYCKHIPGAAGLRTILSFSTRAGASPSHPLHGLRLAVRALVAMCSSDAKPRPTAASMQSFDVGRLQATSGTRQHSDRFPVSAPLLRRCDRHFSCFYRFSDVCLHVRSLQLQRRDAFRRARRSKVLKRSQANSAAKRHHRIREETHIESH